MNVAVTGGTGFVGRHIVDLLVERGHQVRALVRRPHPVPFRRPDSVTLVPGELANPSALATLAAGADALIHLVGIIAERGAATFQAVQVEGTAAAVAAARAGGVARFVHMSAIGARDTPEATPYHRAKAAAERAVAAGHLAHAVVFRPSFISGPGNVPIASLARLHRFAPVVPIFGDGRFPTQPVWIGDAALAFALAAEGRAPGGTYQLGGPAAITYKEFVRAIGRAAGHPRPTIHIPLGLVRLGARLAEVLGPAAPITSDQLQMLVEGSATPHNAIEKVFGITPLPFEDGLRKFLGRRQ